MNGKRIKEYMSNQELDIERIIKDFTRLCIGNP